jgi:phosphoglycolate phosphatase
MRAIRKLIMLDYDGVIVDSLDVFCRVVPPILVEHGFPKLANREQILAFDDGNWFESLAAADIPMSVAEAIEDALAAVVAADGSGPAPFGGVPGVVSRLAERHRVVIVTSSHSALVEDFLRRHGIGGVSGILGSDNDTSKVRKIKAARSHYGRGLDPWYVGDTVGDILEGKAAGVGTIGAAWGWHSAAKLESVSPDHIAYVPNDLLTLFCHETPSP